ncbi:hypothetical protein PASE110613_09035 [Paenibacillus sediminis]|uniref:FtsZ-binding cell division protein ZapB n=1 Tax=Paenibacillus sediminis TaxID=664909 RepID=A0ABS4H6N8_9BACL|nr:hypothetical protein [Paenibacillus sediminis]MBP1938210.1 FtsZ-binding cell division protein ZapB [Paenibacillus sediminis]
MDSEEIVLTENDGSTAVQPKQRVNALTITTAVLSIFALCISVAALVIILTLHSEISDLKSQNTELSAVNNQLQKDQTALNDQQEKYRSYLLLSSIQHDIEDGVVTDDFVAKKVSFGFGKEGNDLTHVVIDLSNQPDMTVAYSGKGIYSIADRELRAKCNSIIKAVKDYYVSEGSGAPVWDDDTKVSLTVQNYEIGKSEAGDFKLVGEK